MTLTHWAELVAAVAAVLAVGFIFVSVFFEDDIAEYSDEWSDD